MQVFIINSLGITINAGMSVKNWLIKVGVLIGLFWIQCECDKFSNVGEYLDYDNCKCRKSLIDKLKSVTKYYGNSKNYV